ncbi:MAG: hypothetical protein HYX99_00995 [Chloroflexi bacterium]|nr:hypothetical protein [Chloroflexota bacterium]
MSKFAERLSQATRDVAPPIGFGAASVARRAAPMLLVADITGTEGNLAAVKELADAALLTVPHTIGLEEQVPRLVRGLGGMPFGVWLEALPEAEVEDLSRLGCDFVVFGSEGTSAAIVRHEGMGKVLAVNTAMPDSMAAAVEGLEVDAVAIRGEEEAGLSLHSLLLYYRFSGLTSRPLMVTAPKELTTPDLEDLLSAGAYSLLVNMEEVGKQGLQKVREAIRQLPTTHRRRPLRARPVVPRPAIAEEAAREEEEEE